MLRLEPLQHRLIFRHDLVLLPSSHFPIQTAMSWLPSNNCFALHDTSHPHEQFSILSFDLSRPHCANITKKVAYSRLHNHAVSINGKRSGFAAILQRV
jgi:hypothetical protein